MLNIRSSKNPAYSQKTVASSTVQKPLGGKVSANIPMKQKKDPFTSTSGGIPTGAPNTSVGYNQITVDLDPMLTGIGPKADALIFNLYKDIYYNDSVAGSAVDLISSLPFSEFTLGGISDQKINATFMEVLERLNIRTLLPEMSVDYLTYGAHVSTLLYNKEKKQFTDMMCHPLENCTFEELPLYSQDPIITVTFEESSKTLAGKRDHPRVKRMIEMIGQKVFDNILAGEIELEPLNTLYIPRRTFSSGQLGTSYFKRILPIYLVEKNLFRGTLMESARRQRGIMHLTVGDGENWEPTEQDLEFITELFMNADSDPLGAIIATKMGIAIEEIRQGGDFWKVTDFQDSVMTHKYHALGISDGLLSGDANYNCIAGNMLITTNEGIFRIDQLADLSKGKTQDLDLVSASRYGKERAAKWLYQGKAPTMTVGIDTAPSVVATPKHRLLSLDGQATDWKKVSDLRIGDHVAVSTHKVVRKARLPLDLDTAPTLHKNQHLTVLDSELTKPKYMTPELAFTMGCIIAEGTVQGNNIKMGNTNRALIDKYLDCFQQVFNFRPTEKIAYEQGSELVVNGRSYSRNHDFHLTFSTRSGIFDWMNELGACHPQGRKYGKTPSYYKEVPWSILQADEESQLSFLAAYLECDGTVSAERNTVSFTSYSKTLLSQLYVMLTSMGFLVRLGGRRVSLYGKDAALLTERLEPYLVSKFDCEWQSDKPRDKYGVPAAAFTQVLADSIVKSNNHETTIRLASGQVISVLKKALKLRVKTLAYDRFDNGEYADLLELLKKVDRSAYARLMELFALRYNFVEVTSLRKSGMKDVYDLSMRPGAEPSYNVNCVVGHNTADASLTVFIDMIRTFREMITRKFFYNKLFPLISLIHGFTVNTKGKVVTRDLMSEMDASDLMMKLNDGSKLFVPTVNWAKQLKPEGDQAYLDMLTGMSEKGVPVPLRVLAAAGGLNIEELLRQADDDVDTRKKIAEYIKKIAALAPKDTSMEGMEGGGGDEESESSDHYAAAVALASSDPTGAIKSVVRARGGKVPLLSRDFGSLSEVHGRTKTGKRKSIFNQRAENERINRMLAKSAAGKAV